MEEIGINLVIGEDEDKNPISLYIKDVTGLINWYKKENEFLKQFHVYKSGNQANLVPHVRDAITYLAQVNTLVNNIHDAQGDENYVSIKESNLDKISQYYINHPKLIYSGSDKGTYIQDIMDDPKNSILAGASLYNYFIGKSFTAHNNNPEILKGIVLAITFLEFSERHVKSTVKAFDKEKLNLISQMQEILEDINNHENKIKEKSEELNKIVSDADNKRKSNQSIFKDFYDNSGTTFEDFMVECKERIEALETFYKNEMALQGPIEYWTSESKKHNKSYDKMVLSSLVFGAILFVMLAIGGSFMFWEDATPAYGKLIFFGLLSSFGIYGVRICVQMMMSSLHLARDAEERVTMLQTYLSLLSENKADDEQKILILHTLFKSRQAGILKNESSTDPPGLAGIVEKLLKPPK